MIMIYSENRMVLALVVLSQSPPLQEFHTYLTLMGALNNQLSFFLAKTSITFAPLLLLILDQAAWLFVMYFNFYCTPTFY